MFQVMHMIQTKRKDKEIKDLIKHTVSCWEAAMAEGFPPGADNGIYGHKVSKATRRARATALVNHCLSRPVTADG